MGFLELFQKKNRRKMEPEAAAQGQTKSTPEAAPQRPTLQEIFVKNLRFLNQKEYPETFFESLFAGKCVFRLGEIDFPSGEVVTGDPMGWLRDDIYSQTLNRQVPPGAYPVELSILRQSDEEIRIAAARVRFRETSAVRHEITMPAGHTIDDYNKPGVLTGFGVDAGLAFVCDARTADEYRTFSRRPWPNSGIFTPDIFRRCLRKAGAGIRSYSGPAVIFCCGLCRTPAIACRCLPAASGMAFTARTGGWMPTKA